ncbi:hypothetical protein ABEB36_005812 [Hypothenemus hampei]|uniref:Myb-like domain-containing protein n=1 Tax=Hypothenemus hampei TaxID=57062 RepID=A0ABD1F059_HYPHA
MNLFGNLKMHNLFLRINKNENLLQLELDLQMYEKFKASKPTVIEYVKTLIHNREIELGEKLEILEWSEDCINFDTIHIAELLSSEIASTSSTSETAPEIWNNNETKFLLDKYETYLNLIGPLKKFKTKKMMWKKISEDIESILNITKTALQCENRYKTIIKRKKKAIDNNKSTGRSRVEVPYESELSRIIAKDDSILPEILVGQNEMKKHKLYESSSENDENLTNIKRKKKKSINDLLLEMQEKKEESRERRHKEKLKAIKDLGNN